MRTESPKQSFTFSGLLCSTLGHDYVVTRKITNHINEYRCTNCGKEVTDSMTGRLEILTSKTRQLNTSLADFFQKKMRRKIPVSYEKANL
ncbi:hypothetical protein POV27_01035 [Aureisphaera galaxeae]|uniref:hypothetical protein n=1 Tax=Aureisphaera galaxeae TaxID=1538023 RepID=UPI00235048A5|nr:hypothetical protein [Aureisphaera galaxeae]MDC8002621.1 hypothetical protein [Aureisphaera galaxeae]